MYWLRSIHLLILGFILWPYYAVAQDIDSLEARADSLYQNFQEERALDLYQQILDEEPNNYKALWRSSFLYSRIGNRFEEQEAKEDYFKEAIELAEGALKVDSADTHSNYVMSVAMGRKSLISGAKERVSAARDIKKYVDRAIKYDNTNAGAWYVLGRWNFKIANLSWLERMAANTLFGGIPGDASNKKAVDAIRKAIDLRSDYIMYYYDLARVYDEMGYDAKAIETCQEGLELPSQTPDDPELKQECKELIQDI